MKWRKVDEYHAVSDAGYYVCKSGRGDGAVYLAWGPSLGLKAKVNYALGERLPIVGEILGRASSSGEAFDLCEQHWREKHGDCVAAM